MKNIAVLMLMLLLLNTCNGGKSKRSSADKIYKENVHGVIEPDVQILDGQKIKLGYGDYTLWVAFDCSKKTWENIKRSKNLRPGSYSLDVPGAKKPTNDTGFESLLKPGHRVFRNIGSKGVFLVQEDREGPVRVVFFLRDW
jgi:hypothetical protein